nr:hypothetical protein [Oxalobacteraceae bacterium]
MAERIQSPLKPGGKERRIGLVVFLLRGDIEAKSCVEDLVAVSDFNEFAGSNAGSNAVPDPKEGF